MTLLLPFQKEIIKMKQMITKEINILYIGDRITTSHINKQFDYNGKYLITPFSLQNNECTILSPIGKI